MKRVLEVRSYTIRKGARDQFHALVSEISYPLMTAWGMDVVAFGPSLHDETSYFPMRAFESEADRQRCQDAVYGSRDWREGPRESIVAPIDADANIILDVEASALDLLRARPQAR